jgi:hypothetical protein
MDELQADLVPVALQLLGDELGEAGEGALPHLRARDADDAGVVGTDGHPDVDLRGGGGGAGACRRGFDGERQVHPDGEPAARGGRTDDELAARNVGRLHALLPAALRTAARMRV